MTALPTVPVRIKVYDPSGSPVAAGRVTARLDRTDYMDGYVIAPETLEGETDDAGLCTLNLWPNELGTSGSLYKIVAYNPDDQNRRYLNVLVAVPNSACQLEHILQQQPFPPIDAAQAALQAMQSALADVTEQAQIATTQAEQASSSAAAAAAAIPAGGTTGQVLAKASNSDGDTEWVNQTGGSGGTGLTNLGYTASATGGTVTSDTGTDAEMPLADGTNAGLMSPAQHTKLAGLPSSADPAGTASSAVSTHLTASDPHSQYAQKSELGSVAALDVPVSGNASADQVVKGSDSRLTDARTPTVHTHQASSISDSTATGRAVMTAIDATAARAAIGAGTSSFSGAYADLSGKPTLGTAAASATTDFATAAQGTKADTALQPAAIGVTVQGYDADLTSWSAIAPSAKQDTLVSGTNIKTVNGSSLLGSGDLVISGGGGTPGGATTQVQFNNAGAFAGAAGLTIDPATGAIKTATETVYELVGTVIAATNGALQFKTLSGATTLTESLASGQAVTLEIYAGAFSVTWPTVYWLNTTSSTTAPILNTMGPTIIELWKRGTTLYGSKVA